MAHSVLAPALISLVTIALLGATLSGDESAPSPGHTRIQRIPWGGWPEAYRLTNGTVEVVVVPASARILHYGFEGEENVLWHNARAAGQAVASGTWTNYGGSKTWIWPQDDWSKRTGSGWPPPTDLPETIVNLAEIAAGPLLRLVSPPIPGFGVKVVREIRLEDTGTRVHITSRLELTSGDASSALAAWTVTQLPADGSVFARLVPGTRTPGGFHPFTGAFASVALEGPRVLCVLRPTAEGAKIGMDADLLAWQRGELLFVERSLDTTSPLSSFAAGDRGQIYSHPDGDPTLPAGVSYIELELTSPLRKLRSGEAATLETSWELLRLGPSERTRKALAARLETM